MTRLNRWLPFRQPRTLGQGMANGFVLGNLWGLVPLGLIVWIIVK